MTSGEILVFGKALIWVGIPLVLMVREVRQVGRLRQMSEQRERGEDKGD